MTNKEALQSMTEYYNENLLLKILIDHGVVTSGTYAAADERVIDLCAADLYGVLVGHPELKEGSQLMKFNAGQLRSMRKEILKKYGLHDDVVKSYLDSGDSLW